MPTVSELQMRILSELEESGEENVVTLLVTTMQPIGAANEVAQLCAALTDLVRADLVRMAVGPDPEGGLLALPQDRSLAVIAELPADLLYDREHGHWTHTVHRGPPYGNPLPFVVPTDSGMAKAGELLDARGVRWWRTPG